MTWTAIRRRGIPDVAAERLTMRIVQAYSSKLEATGRQILLIVRGDREGDRRQRTIDGCARCFVLSTDRPTSARRVLWELTDPPTDRYRWRWPYDVRVAGNRYIQDTAGRKTVLARIAQGNLGIDDRIGPWNGSFWSGLRASGAIRRGPGTEWRVWERPHGELLADISEMPLMHRLEPRAGKHGQRRLRRCYAAFLPAEQSTERSLLAGLFAGAVLCADGGENWLELPDDQRVRSILEEWGMPFRPLEPIRGRHVVWVSPFFGALVAHLMPPHSAARMSSITKAGGCPYLAVVLWEMAIARKNRRYMPFPDALPFGISKATFFRRGWHRRDLHKAGWLDLGIRIVPKCRDLMVDWHSRKTAERQGPSCDPCISP